MKNRNDIPKASQKYHDGLQALRSISMFADGVRVGLGFPAIGGSSAGLDNRASQSGHDAFCAHAQSHAKTHTHKRTEKPALQEPR